MPQLLGRKGHQHTRGHSRSRDAPKQRAWVPETHCIPPLSISLRQWESQFKPRGSSWLETWLPQLGPLRKGREVENEWRELHWLLSHQKGSVLLGSSAALPPEAFKVLKQMLEKYFGGKVPILIDSDWKIVMNLKHTSDGCSQKLHNSASSLQIRQTTSGFYFKVLPPPKMLDAVKHMAMIYRHCIDRHTGPPPSASQARPQWTWAFEKHWVKCMHAHSVWGVELRKNQSSVVMEKANVILRLFFF